MSAIRRKHRHPQSGKCWHHKHTRPQYDSMKHGSDYVNKLVLCPTQGRGGGALKLNARYETPDSWRHRRDGLLTHVCCDSVLRHWFTWDAFCHHTHRVWLFSLLVRRWIRWAEGSIQAPDRVEDLAKQSNNKSCNGPSSEPRQHWWTHWGSTRSKAGLRLSL